MSFISENVKWGVLPYDCEYTDSLYAEYYGLLSELVSIQNKIASIKEKCPLKVEPLVINRFLEEFDNTVIDAVMGRNVNNEAISELRGFCLLHIYLQKTYGFKYLDLLASTVSQLDKIPKSGFVRNFNRIKSIDNQLLYLVCNNKSLRVPLRDFICSKVFRIGEKDGLNIESFSRAEISSLYDYTIVRLKELFSSKDNFYFKLSSNIIPIDELSMENGFDCDSRLYPDIYCSNIRFTFDDIERNILVDNTYNKSDRSVILRDLVREVIDFVATNTDVSIIDLGLPNLRFFYSYEEAQEASRGINYSCSVYRQFVDDVVVYILPIGGQASANIRIVKGLLEAIGVDVDSVTLEFKKKVG